MRLVNGGEASKPQPGRFFENQARLENIFKVVVVYQMSRVSTRCCQALFVSGNDTLWNTDWTKTSHSLIDKFLAPKSYGSETLFAEQFGCKRLRRARDNTGGQNPQPSSAPPKAGLSTCSIQHAIRTGHVFGLLNISGSGSGPAVWPRSSSPSSLPPITFNGCHSSFDPTFASACTFFTSFTPSFHHTECPDEEGMLPPILDTGSTHCPLPLRWMTHEQAERC